jgi:hypothetical protein
MRSPAQASIRFRFDFILSKFAVLHAVVDVE